MPINAFPVQLNQIKGIFDKVDLIHLGPLHPDDIDMSILKESFQRKKLVSLDIQGYVRRICHGNVTAQVSPCLYDALDCTDYVKAKTGELDLVLKDSGVTLEKLIERHNISEFVVTCGGSGGYIMTEKGKTEFDAHPAHEIMDPTGAGDVFLRHIWCHVCITKRISRILAGLQPAWLRNKSVVILYPLIL